MEYKIVNPGDETYWYTKGWQFVMEFINRYGHYIVLQKQKEA